MQAPPLVALAGGAWASPRAAVLAAPASLRRSRHGSLRLDAKAAWRAAGARGSYLVCYLQKQGQASFDASAVDNMRRLLDHSGVPGHLHPPSLLCYEVMPPPQQRKPGKIQRILMGRILMDPQMAATTVIKSRPRSSVPVVWKFFCHVLY